jgi:hypothetical protein
MPDFDSFGNQRVACKIDMVSRLDDVFHCPYHRGLDNPTSDDRGDAGNIFPSGKPEFSILRN